MSKRIIFIGITVGLTFFFVACKNIVSDSQVSEVDTMFDNDTESSSTGGLLTILRPLPFINTTNAIGYNLSGECDPEQGALTVTLGYPSQVVTLNCNSMGDANGIFQGGINLTGVTSDFLSLRVDQGGLGDVILPGESPFNDQVPIETAPQPVLGVISVGNLSDYDLAIDCNEVGEIVTINGYGLEPRQQIHTCASPGVEAFRLALKEGVEIGHPNLMTITSTDINGNPTVNAASVDLSIDNLGPRVSIAKAGDILSGLIANFTVTVSDLSMSSPSYNVDFTGSWVGVRPCTFNPCSVSTLVAPAPGVVTATVASGSVVDDFGNTGDTVDRATSINISLPSELTINEPLPPLTGENGSNYFISGNCNFILGPVTIEISSPQTIYTMDCVSNVYSGHLNLSAIASGTAFFTAKQGVEEYFPHTLPTNDQNSIATAPVIDDLSPQTGWEATFEVSCNEEMELVTFTGVGLVSGQQSFLCAHPSNNPQLVVLDLATNTETSPFNSVVVSSQDSSGNSALASTTFDLPIDNVLPKIQIDSNGDIAEGSIATFTVNVTEANFVGSYRVVPLTGVASVVSGGAGDECTGLVCVVQVSGALRGALNLSVAAGDVIDFAGNSNAANVSKSIQVF